MKRFETGDFFSKVLLFGEYSVIVEGRALMFPLERFSGKLTFEIHPGENETSMKKSNRKLREFAEVIRLSENFQSGDFTFDYQRMKADLDDGLYFCSNIPPGYGVGSSGALVAALFENYFYKPSEFDRFLKEDDIQQVVFVLAEMESFFHGNSSGLDPLCSLFNRPFVADEDKNIHLLSPSVIDNFQDIQIFLVDTQKFGNTKPLVESFLKQVEDYTVDLQRMIYLNNLAIETLLNRNHLEFFLTLKEISFFQWQYFEYMLPDFLHPLWIEGMQTNNWYLKLCGSGGGGFFLGFTKNFDVVQHSFEKHNLNVFRILN